jgi:hypothetical protein
MTKNNLRTIQALLENGQLSHSEELSVRTLLRLARMMATTLWTIEREPGARHSDRIVDDLRAVRECGLMDGRGLD